MRSHSSVSISISCDSWTDRSIPSPEQIEEELTYRLGDVELPADLRPRLHSIKRQLAREPERSRRVIRLLFANWLAHVEDTDPQRRRPAVRARFYIAQRTASVPLYPVGPDAPAGAARRHRRRWQAGWSRPTMPEWPSPLPRVRVLSGRPFARGNSVAIGSCSCSWPVSSITASAAPSRLRKTPWSGPISRACPTTVRPSSAMKRRQPSRIPQARPSRRRGDPRRLRGRSAMSRPALVSRIAVCVILRGAHS